MRLSECRKLKKSGRPFMVVFEQKLDSLGKPDQMGEWHETVMFLDNGVFHTELEKNLEAESEPLTTKELALWPNAISRAEAEVVRRRG